MITVSVFKQSNYPIAASKIKTKVQQTLKEHGIVSDFLVSVALVGEQKMASLVKEYYKEDPLSQYVHPILTFPTSELKGEFQLPPGEKSDLGEMIISYPAAVADAGERGKLVEEVVLELVNHGTLHLIGNHH